MIIENMATKEQWDRVVLYLSKAEASELRDAIDAILGAPEGVRHEHIPSIDFKKEVTVILKSDL